jgi:hypothetical protein
MAPGFLQKKTFFYTSVLYRIMAYESALNFVYYYMFGGESHKKARGRREAIAAILARKMKEKEGNCRTEFE